MPAVRRSGAEPTNACRRPTRTCGRTQPRLCRAAPPRPWFSGQESGGTVTGGRVAPLKERPRPLTQQIPTLSQVWSGNLIQGPQCAFETSMFMCPAVHTSTRSWLRSSSIHEPSDPPFRIIIFFLQYVCSRLMLKPTRSFKLACRTGRLYNPGPALASRTGVRTRALH